MPPLHNGHLPLGRWPATLSDLGYFHTLPDAAHRQQIWQEWQTLTKAIQDAVGKIPAVWLGGSYFSDKKQPGDIDCVYLIHYSDFNQAKNIPQAAQFFQNIIGGGAQKAFGLRVDTYILPWWPEPGPNLGSELRQDRYLKYRGYWDDLWSRKRDTDSILDAVPRVGYLEVIIDGYS